MTIDEIRQMLIHNPDVRHKIALRAFEFFQARSYEPGHDFEDWLRAESEILPELIQQEAQTRENKTTYNSINAVGESAFAEEAVAAIEISTTPEQSGVTQEKEFANKKSSKKISKTSKTAKEGTSKKNSSSKTSKAADA